MKKTISVLLSVLMLVLCFAPSASAISIEEGTPMLDLQFKNDKASNGIDYVYFSPVKSEDPVKYPLFIWLHAENSAKYKRSQLQPYKLSNWASDEYQARFQNAGGCFILAPRANLTAANSWDSTQVFFLKDVIDEFIRKNETHIDTDRIYIAGCSTGGEMVWNMLDTFSDFFAAGIPVCASSQPASTTLSKLKYTSVWIFSCDKDPSPLAKTESAFTTFASLGNMTKRPSGVRITTMSEAVFADYSKKTEWKNGQAKLSDDAEHCIWEAVTYDMHMADGSLYAYSNTLDSKGKAVDFSDSSGVISWLSAQKKVAQVEDEEPGEDASGDFWSMVNSIMNVIITRIATVIEQLLGIKII